MNRLGIFLSVTSLDAPIVALLWQEMIARAGHGTVSPAARAWLFLTAWLIYLADRIADSFTIPPGAAMSARQRLCQKHRRIFVATFILLTVIDAAISLFALERRVIVPGLIVGLATLIYLAVNHLSPRLWKILPLKEAAIGFLFTVGTVVAINFASPPFLQTFLFALLCSLNCLSISFWERKLDLSQGRISFATEHGAAHAAPAVGACLVAAASLSLETLVSWPMAVALATSSLGLVVLNFAEDLNRDSRVAAADLVLLTPAFFLLPKL